MDYKHSQSETKIGQGTLQPQQTVRSSKSIIVIENISDVDTEGRQNEQNVSYTENLFMQRPNNEDNLNKIVQMSKRRDEINQNNSSVNMSQTSEVFSSEGEVQSAPYIKGSLQQPKKCNIQKYKKNLQNEKQHQHQQIQEHQMQQTHSEIDTHLNLKSPSEKDHTQSEVVSQSNQGQYETKRIQMNSKIGKEQLKEQVIIATPQNKRNRTKEQENLMNLGEEKQITTEKAVKTKQFDEKFFEGRISVVWIFIITQLDTLLEQQLNKLFQNLVAKGCQKLLSASIQQAQRKFFHAQNSIFNIVSDLSNAEQLLSNRRNLLSKILSIYLYNNDNENGIIRSTHLKLKSHKVKGIYKDLSMILKRAKLDIDNGNRFQQVFGNIQEIKYRSKFPTFIKLSNQDASQITEYRINLYGAIKLTDKEQREEKLEQFASLVKRVYHKNQGELQNLNEYLDKIDHSVHGVLEGVSEVTVMEKHKRVLRFYVRQTFYYKITNNLLRTCRNVNDFKPIILPFNENYNAIKYLHNSHIQRLNTIHGDNWDNVPEYILYRGASLTKNEFESIRVGDFIELLGCISASKSQQYVMNNFIRGNDDYLFIFKVRQRRLRQDYKCFDHGFADLNLQNDIVPQQFQKQQQVLLNALNVYKVTSIQMGQDRIGRITFEYGSIFDLLERPYQLLTDEEKCVLLNYRYCMKEMNQIKDQGDVFMKLQQFDKAKQFNQNQVDKLQQERIQLKNQQFTINQQTQKEARDKILKEKQKTRIQYLNKLSLAFYNCGQTEEARVSAIKSLQSCQREMKKKQLKDRQLCKKIFEIHSYSLKTLTQTEDTPSLIKIIAVEMQILDQQGDWLRKAQKLIQRGQIYLKQGRIIQSEIDLKQSETILLTKKNSFDVRKSIIEKTYYYRSLINCLCFKNPNLEKQREHQLQKVDQDYQRYLMIKNKLQELLFKVNQCLRNVAQTVGDKKTYEECVKKGRQYFQQLDKNATNKQEVAQIKVIEAKVLNALQKKANIQKSYQLVGEAINIIEQINPNHEKVAQYNKILGQFKKNQCLKSLKISNKDEKKRLQEQNRLGSAEMRQRKNNYAIQSQSHIVDNEQDKKKHNCHKKNLKETAHKMMRGTEQQIDEMRRRQQEQRRKREEIQRQIQRQNQFGLFNQPKYKPKYLSIKQCFMKALKVLIFNKTQQNPEVFQVKNSIGEVEYEFSNYEGGKKQACDVLRTKNGSRHSEGAKSALLLAKISLAQGQIKEAFVNIEKAHFILRLALVKDPNNPRYQQLYVLSPIFLQIQLYKCKIYNRQKNHDLALRTITNLRDLGRRKLRNADGVGYLADIYEQMGNTLVNKGSAMQFEKCYEKAINLREKQMGKYNILNAIANCSLAKYLVFTNDPDTAQNRVTDSIEIFSHFDKNHPNFWVHSSTMAFLSQKRQEKESELMHIRNSVKLVEKRLSKNNINLLKIKLRYAQVLSKNDKDEEALKIFQHLRRQMQNDVSLSQREDNLKETDNEKVAVRDVVKRNIEQTTLRITNKNQLQETAEIINASNVVNEQLQAHDETKAQLKPGSPSQHLQEREQNLQEIVQQVKPYKLQRDYIERILEE